MDVLGDLLGGPGALKSKFGRVLFERPIWLPVQTPLFHPNLPRKCPQRGASWRLLELLCVQKLVKKCAQASLRGPYAAQRWVSIVSLPFVAAAGWTSTANVRGALCLLHAPCAINIANSKTTNLKVDLFLGAAVSRERLQ